MKKLLTAFIIFCFSLSCLGMIIIPPRNKAHYSLAKGANCKLLIHSNTTDGSTTFTDSSGQGHTVSVGVVDVEHDTAEFKFGTSSILFDGDSGYLSIADSDDWDFDVNPFTVDFWVKFNSIPDGTPSAMGFWSQYTDANNYIVMRQTDSNQIEFLVRLSGVSRVALTGSWTPSTNIWYHIALIRGWGGNANDWVITVNGTPVATTTTINDVWNAAVSLLIGIQDTGTGYYLDGWIDEFRIVNGTAIWTANFWPPPRQFE